jgi:hypothetical protein
MPIAAAHIYQQLWRTGQDLTGLANKRPRCHWSAGTNTAHNWEGHIYQTNPYKEAPQSRQIKLLCCKRNQDLVKYFFSLSFILSREAKKNNPRKQKTYSQVQAVL